MAQIEIQNGDDWVVVKVNGKKWPTSSGHRISDHDWVEILNTLGITVDLKFGTFVDDDEDNFMPD